MTTFNKMTCHPLKIYRFIRLLFTVNIYSVVSMASHGVWFMLKLLVISVFIEYSVTFAEDKVVKFLNVKAVKTPDEFTNYTGQPTVTAVYFMLKGKISLIFQSLNYIESTSFFSKGRHTLVHISP